MKILLTLVLTISTASIVFASAPKADEKCGAEVAECKDAHAGGHHGGLTEKMNSLYPEMQQDKAYSARPAVTQITAPAFMSSVATGPIQLAWKQIEGVTDYHVQVATDPHFKWLVANEHFIKTNSYEFTKAEAGKKYFWRVASFKSTNKESYTKSNFVSSAFSVR